MYHYGFTNDFRIESEGLSSFIQKRAQLWIENKVPNSTEDKSLNNTSNAAGKYFNLIIRGNCAYAAANGETQKVILNFIKKYQFPNPCVRPQLFSETKQDGILVAPLRTILKLLYIIYLNEGDSGYLTKQEISDFIFYNDSVAKSSTINYLELYSNIIECRKNRSLPETIVPKGQREWNYEDRQLGTMLTIMIEAKCIKENRGKYSIQFDKLNAKSKSEILDIITYNEFWDGEDINSYYQYMEIESFEEERLMEQKYTVSNGGISRNRIIFGAPGTGKSYSLNKQIKTIVSCNDDGKVKEEFFERVTFYPSYTYAQFVGTYKPKPKKIKEKDNLGNEIEKEIISYEFVPGPLTRILAKALESKMKNRDEKFLLIIEEINRANAAAVFGDVFQLLDRKPDGNSEYTIETSEEMRAYLAKELKVELKECSKLSIPENLYIWATMNSADQGVTPMDTAFKRRWDFEYISVDAGEFARPYLNAPITIGTITTSWNKIRKEINRLLQTPNIRLSEDKLIGPFFLSESAFISSEMETIGQDSNATIDENKFKAAFKSKVLMYLFEDAVKSKKSSLFEASTFASLCEDFNTIGLMIFKGLIEENVIMSDEDIEQENVDASNPGEGEIN